MVWIAAPLGYKNPQYYAEGDVKSAAGAIIGRFKMGLVSYNHRKAKVEINTAASCKAPSDSGLGHTWAHIFSQIRWDVVVAADETSVLLASNGEWSDADVHEAMLAQRKAVDLDAEWRYQILSVNRLSTPMGMMYNADAADSNNVPRECVEIANDWIVPSGREWESEQGKRFADSKPLFFRTAVRELGHAFGLCHETVDIAISGTNISPHPTNFTWNYVPEGLRGLRHFPDPLVGPRGVSLGRELFNRPQGADVGMDMLELRVTPLESEVPLGAPVRVLVELKNNGPDVAVVPADISLRSEKRSWRSQEARWHRSLLQAADPLCR